MHFTARIPWDAGLTSIIPAHLLTGPDCGTVATTRDREFGVMPSSAAAVSISLRALLAMHSAGFGSG